MWLFQARQPTRAVWPVMVRILLQYSASQISTTPFVVPMASVLPYNKRRPYHLTNLIRPIYSGDRIIRIIRSRSIAKFGDFARLSRPQIDTRVEPDTENVRRRPRDEIEVKVILQSAQPPTSTHGQLRRIKHFERCPCNLTYSFPWTKQNLLARLPHRTQTILIVRHIVQPIR